MQPDKLVCMFLTTPTRPHQRADIALACSAMVCDAPAKCVMTGRQHSGACRRLEAASFALAQVCQHSSHCSGSDCSLQIFNASMQLLALQTQHFEGSVTSASLLKDIARHLDQLREPAQDAVTARFSQLLLLARGHTHTCEVGPLCCML